MKRRGFFAALLVAPFAAATLLSKPVAVRPKKWTWIYETGARRNPTATEAITRQAFLAALEAEERVLQVTGTRQLRINEIERTILVRNSLYDPT